MSKKKLVGNKQTKKEFGNKRLVITRQDKRQKNQKLEPNNLRIQSKIQKDKENGKKMAILKKIMYNVKQEKIANLPFPYLFH